ncbi:MAG: M48 family metalloprotease, partial [Planctomycetota bacterium]
MIEGVAGLAVALLVAVGAAGQPDALEGWGWVVALAWTVAFALLDRRGLGRAIAHAEARRRGELVGAPVRLAPLAVLRVLTFVGVTALGWWEPWRAAWFGGASPYLGLPLAIVPFLAGWILSLPARRELAIARHGRPWPKGAFLRLHLRVLLVPAIMIGALLAAGEFASIDPVWADWFLLRPVAAFMVVALVLVPLTLAIVAPLALRFALPGHSLPPGALRTRFEEVARRESFRPLDIRVVDTSGHVINAAFVGILGRLRYVFIFDGLLERLDEDELVGVFAHEMGHSRRSHPLVYLALATAYSATVTVADMLLGDTGGVALDVLLPLVALVVFLRFVFSPVSRTFETEADVFAARALDGPGPIARALEALGDLHPSRRRQGGLLHPGIEDRVRFLRAWWDDPALREAFSGRILALRTVVFAYLALALIGLVALLPGEMGRASVVTAVRAASDADDEAEALAALDRLDEALRAGDIEDPGAHMRLRLLQVASTERQD